MDRGHIVVYLDNLQAMVNGLTVILGLEQELTEEFRAATCTHAAICHDHDMVTEKTKSALTNLPSSAM